MTGPELIEQIKIHDRIVMLGHVTTEGLIGYNDYYIENSYAPLLKLKDCVCIWCNADKFVEKHDLKGFYTGMMISEIVEAMMYDIDVEEPVINESNILFAEAVRNAMIQPDMLKEARRLYNTEDNPVIAFNMIRMYYRSEPAGKAASGEGFIDDFYKILMEEDLPPE